MNDLSANSLVAISHALLWGVMLGYFAIPRSKQPWLGRLVTGMATTSWGLLTAGLVRRGLIAGHWPLTNRYEVALCISWSILAIYLLLEVSWRQRGTGGYVLAIALIMMVYAQTRPADERIIFPLLPVLRSIWLQIHVLCTLIAYGAFGVAAGLALARLMKRGTNEDSPEKLIPAVQIERNMDRSVALGFPWLTLGILTGAIWAQNAWGRYWGWDVKEIWALVTWLWYLMVFHVRSLRTWRGRRSAWLSVIGYGVVLFTFIGVPWLVRTVRLESLHGF